MNILQILEDEANIDIGDPFEPDNPVRYYEAYQGNPGFVTIRLSNYTIVTILETGESGYTAIQDQIQERIEKGIYSVPYEDLESALVVIEFEY